MLTGKTEPQKLNQELSRYPDYDGQYQADPRCIDELSQVSQTTHIAVIIGTWCPDCHRDIPRFMSILNAADNPRLSAEYIGVNREKAYPRGHSEHYDFTRLPTYIVMRDGKEIGRVTERPQTTLEQDLVNILS